MRKLIPHFLLLALMMTASIPANAQQARKSPHETISTVVDEGRVMVVYGRPYTKNPTTGETRKIWGGLVPLGEIWRLGADEATLLVTEKTLKIGDATVPAGAYSLWAIPAKDGSAKLVINKQIGQWGIFSQYDAKKDLARVDLDKKTLDKPVDQLTMQIEKAPTSGGVISFAWENLGYSVPFTVIK